MVRADEALFECPMSRRAGNAPHFSRSVSLESFSKADGRQQRTCNGEGPSEHSSAPVGHSASRRKPPSDPSGWENLLSTESLSVAQAAHSFVQGPGPL